MRRSRFLPTDFLSQAWRSVVFVLTLRAIAKPYRSRRLYPADVEAGAFDGAIASSRIQ
ncbi:hypothetical protein [Caulobacter sp. RL271]|jgi:hypothetical protein|uniref:Uncharacterized protein n=1 Tax=Caulobacter segnis TaxID=88688 RepID=A0ABY4ZQP9_9CAUL|nr:hypothetical protein [Caulobacter segnis]USQ95123.1 hypothetical protein MZV50_21595 [Caulobacter segnis]